MNKKMIIKGVGYLIARDPNSGELLTLANLQNLRIDMTVELEDIFGGDGYFPIDTLVRSKSINVQATDAKFDLNVVRLMMGSEITAETEVDAKDSFVHVVNEQKDLPFSTGTPTEFKYTLDFGTDLFDDDVSVRVVGSNKYLKKVSGAPADGTEFSLDKATGEITVMVDPSISGMNLSFNYKRKTKVDLVALLANEVPFPVSVVHHGSFQQKDGKYQGIETELYMCRARGSLNFDFARATAAVSQITLTILDPERADGRLGTIKRYEATKQI